MKILEKGVKNIQSSSVFIVDFEHVNIMRDQKKTF